MTDREILPACGICYSDPPINGIQLKCGHIFCYLCIKSASETTCACALCRYEIGDEFNFQEHNLLGTIKLPSSQDGQYWFYEGYQGWWLFDADTNREIENAIQDDRFTIEKYIAGGFYIIDLIRMEQRLRDEPGSRIRKILKAKLDSVNVLGMAGLKGKDFREALEMMRISQRHNLAIPPSPPTRHIH